jgi:hypothetical protein
MGSLGRSIPRTYISGTALSGAIRPIWSSLRNIYHPNLEVEEAPLFTLDKDMRNQMGEWNTFDDRQYGGNSSCQVQKMSDEGFIRFSGKLDLDEEKAEELEVVGGYCAFKGHLLSTVDLRDYEGFLITLRSPMEDAVFTLNLGTTSLFDDDIYQVKCEIARSNEWKSLEVPFGAFSLTSHGRVKEYQRANDSLQVESFGFLFKTADDVTNFTLELKGITAVPVLQEAAGGNPY